MPEEKYENPRCLAHISACSPQLLSAEIQHYTDRAILMLLLQVVIIQPVDTGSKSHPFPHALVAGIERYPLQVTRRMSKTRAAKRSKIKPFIKTVNYNHLMPTRYTLELEGLKGVVTNDTFKEVSQREEAKKTVKRTLEERYTSGKNRWFFTPLSKNTTLLCGSEPASRIVARFVQRIETDGANRVLSECTGS